MWFPLQQPSVDSGDATNNGQIHSFDRSVTPTLQDFYHPAGYASTAYYYGGNMTSLEIFICLVEILRSWVIIIPKFH